VTKLPLLIDKEHPAFAGHFPGFPVFPGAALLDLVLHAIESSSGIAAKGWQLANAKFMDMVRPGDEPYIEYELPNEALIRFVVRVGEHPVVSGTLAKIALPLA
jgi:3-hydroxymyristoyl/3-hydroxydecanoyl-(acyl carrier protein) dehydratase